MSIDLDGSFKKTAATVALAAMLSLTPVANDAMAADTMSAGKSAASYSAPTQRKGPVSRQAFNASKQLGAVGVFINRAPNEDVSTAELEELAVFLLEEQDIRNYHIFSHQASGGDTTSFRIFIAERSKQYTFGDVEDGFKIAKKDLETSIWFDEYNKKIISGEITASLTSLTND